MPVTNPRLLLLIFALLWAQGAVASHEHAAVPDDSVELCEVCIHAHSGGCVDSTAVAAPIDAVWPLSGFAPAGRLAVCCAHARPPSRASP